MTFYRPFENPDFMPRLHTTVVAFLIKTIYLNTLIKKHKTKPYTSVIIYR